MKAIRTLALVNVDAAGGIDPARLARGMNLDVTRLDRGRYRVVGGDKAHYVDLITPRGERCDCGDHVWRQVVCKHMLACMLREGDERVIIAVARLVSRLASDVTRLRATLRGPSIVLSPALKIRVATASGYPLNDLRFVRDRSEESSDVEVIDRETGAVVGVITRANDGPLFLPHAPEQNATDAAPPIAA